MASCRTTQKSDLVGSTNTFVLHWGLPVAAMIAALFAALPATTLIWTGSLAWMGMACLINARGCGRTHCYFTGPFFLFMIIPVLLHGFAIVRLGPHGWVWLALAIGTGTGALWIVTEEAWGKYAQSWASERIK